MKLYVRLQQRRVETNVGKRKTKRVKDKESKK
jgi:hypothetical protein